MVILHDTCACRVVASYWKSGSPSVPIRYDIISDDLYIGKFERCQITEQWILILEDDLAVTFEFSQKIWNALWQSREEFLATTLNKLHSSDVINKLRR